MPTGIRLYGAKAFKEQGKIKEQLNELWKYAQSVAASELDDTDPSGFDKIDQEKVSADDREDQQGLKGQTGKQ